LTFTQPLCTNPSSIYIIMSLPDIATNPDAVLGDLDAKWRTGSGPNGQPPLGPYRKTREYYNASE
jgi:hypothetical protein